MMICSTASGCEPNLAARQTSADCIVSVAKEVGYPDALFRAHFLVGSLAQLLDLHAQRTLAGDLTSQLIVSNPAFVLGALAPSSSIVQDSEMQDCGRCLPCLSQDQ